MVESEPSQYPDALPIGTVLGEFTITKVIGEGGFGIVYMAYDATLERTVAIKEYLPITIAARTSAHSVVVRSTQHIDSYTAGLQSFIREARLQARFSHAAMLEVYRVWEQNATAYMAMRYYPGSSLRDLRRDPQTATLFDETAIRQIVSPVFDALEELHSQSVLHRDVSPDNILMLPSGAPVLLDFGAARTVVAGAAQSLTTVLKPGYAPIEQYADDGTMEQGPWTDVYGLGAVLHFLAIGSAPPQAIMRIMGGTLREFDQDAPLRFSPSFIAAVNGALAVKPLDRLQSVAALRDALGWRHIRASEPITQTAAATPSASIAPDSQDTTQVARDERTATLPSRVNTQLDGSSLGVSLGEPATARVASASINAPAAWPTHDDPEQRTLPPSRLPVAVKGRRATRWSLIGFATLAVVVAVGMISYLAATRTATTAATTTDSNRKGRALRSNDGIDLPKVLPPPTLAVPPKERNETMAPPIENKIVPNAPRPPSMASPPVTNNPPRSNTSQPETDPAPPRAAAIDRVKSAANNEKRAPQKRSVDAPSPATLVAPPKPETGNRAPPALDICERLFAKLSLGNAVLTDSEKRQLPSCR